MQAPLKEVAARDALGNLLDPDVKYARGKILRGPEDEASRQQHGLDLITRRISKEGVDSLYNLLGVSRAQPIESGDLENLSFLGSLIHLRGKAELAGLNFLGGDPSKHMGFVTNRVSASIVASMMAMVKKGEMVLCVGPDGRTHPSVKLGIRLAGGSFVECTGYKEFEGAVSSVKKASTVVITTITPQLRHLPFGEVKKIVGSAKSRGMFSYIDDAHCAIRMVAYDEPPPMLLEPDATAISSDKHIFGPRAGVMAGHKQIMQRVRAISLELGMEAQSPIQAGVHHALVNHSVEHIRRSLKVAKELQKHLEKVYPGWFYYVNDCAALTDESLVKLVAEASGHKISLVPQEACSALSMIMLKEFGLITVSTTASPGAAPYLRLVTWPDGYRIPVSRIVDAVKDAVGRLVPIADDAVAVRKIIMGS